MDQALADLRSALATNPPTSQAVILGLVAVVEAQAKEIEQLKERMKPQPT